jgi:hypothetical protein
MADQTSFRLPPEMLRALGRLARQRGIKKSQLVREALEQYLASQGTSPQDVQPMTLRERTAPYIGSINLGSGDTEDITVRIRRQNWRE